MEPRRSGPIQTCSRAGVALLKFHLLKPGSYLIRNQGPGNGSAVNAEVSANRVKRTASEYLWSGHLRGQNCEDKTLAGTLASNKPRIPFQDIHVEAMTAGAQAPLAAKTTRSEGHFHFRADIPLEFTFFTSASNKKAFVLRICHFVEDISPRTLSFCT